MGSTTSLISSDSALAYLFVLFLPSIPSLLARFRQWRAPPPGHPSRPVKPTPPRPARLYLLLGIHTLYRIKQLVQPPFNVFTQFRIPLSANRELLQAAFVRYYAFLAGSAGVAHTARDLPESMQKLVGRLSNVDYRLLYARYGHEVLEGCGWCSTHDDFAVAALPGIVAPYAGLAVLLGLLGLDSISGQGASMRAGRMRSAMGWALAGMVGVEIGVRYLWDLRIVQGDATQLDSTLTTLRTLILLLLPLIYTFLPLSHTSSSRLLDLIPSLHTTSNTIRLTALARSAISADPTLRAQWTAMSNQAERERAVARTDEWVGQAAQRQGLGMDEGGGVRSHAARWVGEQWRGLISIQAGPPPPAEKR